MSHQNSADHFQQCFRLEINWGDLPWPTLWAKMVPKVAGWGGGHLLHVDPSCHPRICSVAYSSPYRSQSFTDSFPKRLTILIYNFSSHLRRPLGASNLYFWTKLWRQIPRHGAYPEPGISYRFYECCVHWASGSIHFHCHFTAHLPFAHHPSDVCSAFTAAFSMIPVQHHTLSGTPFTNLSVNADALRTQCWHTASHTFWKGILI